MINRIINAVFDVLLIPLGANSPWPGMLVISLLSTIVVLLIFRFTSKPAVIRRRKDIALARLLELRLYKDDPVTMLRALGRVLTANLFYMATFTVPIAVSLIPVILIMAQCADRFANRPLRPGESAVMTVQFQQGEFPGSRADILTTSENIRMEAEVRIPAEDAIAWRITAWEEGKAWVDISAGRITVRKSIAMNGNIGSLSCGKVQVGFWSSILSPGEPPLPAEAGIVSVEIAYPSLIFHAGPFESRWLTAFLVLSLLWGLLLIKPLKVTL